MTVGIEAVIYEVIGSSAVINLNDIFVHKHFRESRGEINLDAIGGRVDPQSQ